MAFYTSKKNIIKIDVFMENFLGIKYDGNEKLTHGIMRQFLLEKGHKCPSRAIFSKIKKSDILSGKVLIVKDKSGKTIGYHNPNANFRSLLEEIHLQTDSVQNENRRAEILKEQDFLLLNNGDIVAKYDEEDTIDFQCKTREKCFVFSKKKRVMPSRRR